MLPDPTRWSGRAPSGVTTLLCDADGNLFPSEEPAFDASVGVTNRFLAEIGSTRRWTAAGLRREALGRNFRSLASDMAHEQGRTMSSEDMQAWVDEEAAVVTRHLATALKPDPAATEALRELAEHFRLAVVSSSSLARLDACFSATGLAELFPTVDRFSAQDSLPAPTSKPDPAVYLHALRELDITEEQAVAVEDAVAGVASAVAAGITTIGNLVHVPAGERDERAEALRAAGAAAVVADWRELVELMHPELDRTTP